MLYKPAFSFLWAPNRVKANGDIMGYENEYMCLCHNKSKPIGKINNAYYRQGSRLWNNPCRSNLRQTVYKSRAEVESPI